MQKRTLTIAGLFILAAVAAAAVVFTYYPIYYITGRVNDVTGAQADGHRICFYKNNTELLSGIYAIDKIGPEGLAKTANLYDINAFQTLQMKFKPGEAAKVAVIKDRAGYGAGPVDITFTGKGFEQVPDLTMALGAGIDEPPTQAGLNAPVFKEIWFGNRMYHASLVAKGDKYITSPVPLVKAIIEGVGDAGIKRESVNIRIDGGDPQTMNATSSKAVGNLVSSMNVEFQVSDKLSEGDHVFTFSAAEASGVVATSETCTVSIMGGPAQIIGDVYPYPQPFSPKKDGTCDIQYTMSVDADIEIYLYSVTGEIIKKLYGRKGQEGGSAGTNKVKWDGLSTYGDYAGNGIYAGTIYDPAQGKTLAKFKLTVFH